MFPVPLNKGKFTMDITNNSNKSEITIGGSSFLMLLFLLFLGLKLGNIITWSWWWIFCPLWGPFAILVLIVFFVVMYYLVSKQNKKFSK